MAKSRGRSSWWEQQGDALRLSLSVTHRRAGRRRLVQEYRATNIRLFTYPRPTVAAVNGHAFAGGLITAAVCDYRVTVADGSARFGLNEVPIGIPMPAVYVRMLAHAWGDPVAARTCLLG